MTTNHPLEHVDYRDDDVKEEDKSTEHRSIKQHLCVIKSSAMKKVESSIILDKLGSASELILL